VQVDEPGELKNFLDKCWQSIKAGLCRGLSVGFRATKLEPLEKGLGYLIREWEIVEISAVVVPANQDCQIATVKAIDKRQERHVVVKLPRSKHPVVKLPPAPPRIITREEQAAHRWFMACCDRLHQLKQVARPGRFRLEEVSQLNEQLRLAELSKAHAFKQLQEIRGVR
jgi:hypothetical protein